WAVRTAMKQELIAEARGRLAAAAEAAAATARSEADAEAAAVASAASALDRAYARLATARGTTPAREKQAHLTERAEADAAAPGGAGAGGGGRGDAAPPPPAPGPPPAPVPPPPGAGPVMSPAQAQAHARTAISRYGWGEDQFSCLVRLWNRESGWRAEALNRSSGAYGIPQALPAEKMASAGPDWRTNATTQIAWGLAYIKARYASPCGAWDHSERTGWY
ncbi:transglycosylase, partial [Microbacterium wangchenii]